MKIQRLKNVHNNQTMILNEWFEEDCSNWISPLESGTQGHYPQNIDIMNC